MDDDAAERADYAALQAHDAASTTARAQSSLLAEKIWEMLRGLGVARGRMLVAGTDAAVYTGAPDIDGPGRTGEWVAPIPPAEWPHRGLRLSTPNEWVPEKHDVIIVNLPYADLRARRVENARTLLDMQNRTIAHALQHTFSGGIAVAIASHQVLDHPDAETRLELRALADLVGAARLPSGLFHPGHEQSAPTDLLVLRRRAVGERVDGRRFQRTGLVDVDGTDIAVNEYFRERPEHFVGTPHASTGPDGDAQLTVTCDDGQLSQVLRTVLSRIIQHGQAIGLTATSASWNPPDERIARYTDTPQPPRPLLNRRDIPPIDM